MSSSSPTKESVRAASSRGGKYLTFALGREKYGLEILRVREIIGYAVVAPVPGTPPFVEGVINLRGTIVPVVDLRARFAMKPAERTRQTCIIVVETRKDGRGFSTGLVVDHVLEVVEIADKDIEGPPALGSCLATDFITGLAKSRDSVQILLDIDRVLETNYAPVAPPADTTHMNAA